MRATRIEDETEVGRRTSRARRIVRDDGLVPWHVSEKHRWDYDLALLRMEARRRAGAVLSPADEERLAQFLVRLGVDDQVLHYDPDSGFSYVPRRPGVDADLVREPDGA